MQKDKLEKVDRKEHCSLNRLMQEDLSKKTVSDNDLKDTKEYFGQYGFGGGMST